MSKLFHEMTLGERRKKNLASHELVKTGDADAEGAIVDRNGEVVLAFCRRCRGGEAELEDQSCVERLLKLAIEAEAKLPPLRRAMNAMHQKFSWVRAESMMNDDASPNGRTVEEAEALLAKVSPEFVVLRELERRIAEDSVVLPPGAVAVPRDLLVRVVERMYRDLDRREGSDEEIADFGSLVNIREGRAP